MTAAEILQLQELYARYNYRCFVCGKPATQRAHIMGRTKPNYKRYGKAVVDNPLNWLPACDLDCNALIDASDNLLLKEQIAYIINHLDIDDLQHSTVERWVRENIERKRNKRLTG